MIFEQGEAEPKTSGDGFSGFVGLWSQVEALRCKYFARLRWFRTMMYEGTRTRVPKLLAIAHVKKEDRWHDVHVHCMAVGTVSK